MKQAKNFFVFLIVAICRTTGLKMVVEPHSRGGYTNTTKFSKEEKKKTKHKPAHRISMQKILFFGKVSG